MDVDRPIPRCGKQRLRKDETVSRYDERIRPRRAYALDAFRRPEMLGLGEDEAALQRIALDRAGNGMEPASRGAVGLREDESDIVSSSRQAHQRLLGKLRGARED